MGWASRPKIQRPIKRSMFRKERMKIKERFLFDYHQEHEEHSHEPRN
jgi:hypothetical protein